jgi:C-terminal processing protease CtpA/Prc
VALRKAREHTQSGIRVKVRHVRVRKGFGAIVGAALGSLLLVLACAAEEGTIGAMLGQRADGRLFVRDVPPALAAAQGGLQPGDEILLIDGKDVRAMDASLLHRALSGEVSGTVKLTVMRHDAVFRVTLTRTPVPSGAAAESR